MDFNEKLKQLRQNKQWTQEELAERLFISRTAVSKWESGRGFPSIDSLKAISQVFDISIDELLSNSELLSIAENEQQQQRKNFQHLLLGISDCMVGLLIVLPIFGQAQGNHIAFVSLWQLSQETIIFKLIIFSFVILTMLFGIFELAFSRREQRIIGTVSLILSLFGVLLFIMTRHPYPATYVLMLLAVKGISLLNSR